MRLWTGVGVGYASSVGERCSVGSENRVFISGGENGEFGMAANKRMVDYGALWNSDKVRQLEPRHQSEVAYLFGLANEFGKFECDARSIWAQAYSRNRVDWSVDDVAALLDDFARVKLLFRWTAAGGKVWAFFVGTHKPSRLLPPSKRENAPRGPKIPRDAFCEFLGEDAFNAYVAECPKLEEDFTADVCIPRQAVYEIVDAPSQKGMLCEDV